jgi:F-type H+-transporting ATPase subunit epsilon
MADKLKFDLVSPERILMSEDVDMVTVPASEGQFGVLAHHAPALATLKPGILEVQRDEKTKRRIFVRGGFAEVTPEGLTVLAEEAIEEERLNREVLAQEIADAVDDVSDAADDASRQRAQEALDSLREIDRSLKS